MIEAWRPGIVTVTAAYNKDGCRGEVTYKWDPPDANFAEITREAFDMLASDAGWREKPL